MQPLGPRLSLRSALLKWYRARKRPMPWRQRVTPYRTWVSEVMLQQTTVSTVTPRFEAFIAKFPSISALARSRESDVLRAWSGLGYYSRARNLRLAAKKIMACHGGEFPADFDQALALPGIGRYCAGAILSIAFAKPYPVVDGNVMRVFARWGAIKDDLKSPRTVSRFWALAEELLDRRSPGDWNQALMELGATVCVPQAPRCDQCPVRQACQARASGIQDRLPVSSRKPLVDLRLTCLWIEAAGRVLLWKRSESERLLKGHWGLPEARHFPRLKPGRLLRAVRHTITQHRISLEVRRADPPAKLPAQARWVGRWQLNERLISSLWLKGALVK